MNLFGNWGEICVRNSTTTNICNFWMITVWTNKGTQLHLSHSFCNPLCKSCCMNAKRKEMMPKLCAYIHFFLQKAQCAIVCSCFTLSLCFRILQNNLQEQQYLNKAEGFYNEFPENQVLRSISIVPKPKLLNFKGRPGEFSWDDKTAGAQLLLFELTQVFTLCAKLFYNTLFSGWEIQKQCPGFFSKFSFPVTLFYFISLISQLENVFLFVFRILPSTLCFLVF